MARGSRHSREPKRKNNEKKKDDKRNHTGPPRRNQRGERRARCIETGARRMERIQKFGSMAKFQGVFKTARKKVIQNKKKSNEVLGDTLYRNHDVDECERVVRFICIGGMARPSCIHQDKRKRRGTRK